MEKIKTAEAPYHLVLLNAIVQNSIDKEDVDNKSMEEVSSNIIECIHLQNLKELSIPFYKSVTNI